MDLVDPHDETVRDTVRALRIMGKSSPKFAIVLVACIHFITESNRHLPQALKDQGLRNQQFKSMSGNYTSNKRGAHSRLLLSSLNLDKFDEWKDSTLVEDMNHAG